MRLVVFSERLRSPYDEGIKSVATQLSRVLAVEHHVLTLTSGGESDDTLPLHNLDTNRLLLGSALARAVRCFGPDAVVYVPTACGTVFSFARAQVLRTYARGAPTVLVALQPRSYDVIGRKAVAHLKPDWVVVQSQRTAAVLEALGCRVSMLPPAVDSGRFRPVPDAAKRALRSKHGIPVEASVATHVGHLKAKRNLKCLQDLADRQGYHLIVVASTSTRHDAALAEQLRSAGVTVIDWYVDDLEEIYALSDVYLFLATETTAAIEVPLSVLEAMASGLRIVCTPFGGLPGHFPEGQGFYYWDGISNLGELIDLAVSSPCETRSMVTGLSWSAAADSLVQLVSEGTARS